MKNRTIKLTAILLALGALAVVPMAQAVVPAPDGGYPGFNTAEGQNALFSRTTGVWNTALGGNSLYSNTTGSINTAVGLNALRHNVQGGSNTAVGVKALFANIGDTSNGAGFFNSALGAYALSGNTTGHDNCAFGASALYGNADGTNNTAFGSFALRSNLSGNYNTAVGVDALQRNGSGGANTALGHGAGANVTTGSFNVYIGPNVGGVSNEVGHTYISNINSTIQPPINGSEYVTVHLADGLLGHTSSSRRYKEDIKPMENASEELYRLKPVTYRYKKEIDPSQNLDYGLVAEDVAKVDPKLAICNGNGQVESVRYNAINAMLLNEFLKAHRKVEEQNGKLENQARKILQQGTTITELKKELQTVVAHLKEQDSRIQKVSAQVEINRPAQQAVASNQ